MICFPNTKSDLERIINRSITEVPVIKIAGCQQKLHVHKPFNGYHPAILITGTSVGIGHDAALTLAKKGYTVFATVRKQKDLEDLKKKFEESIDDGEKSPNKEIIKETKSFIFYGI
ncbi:2696_t:CDS:2 [Entrophospora sp. SA101]|nr:2696_t:CDS:2 [Entrophospora sp. SA101]